jgi:glutathione S-transferase
MLVLYHFPLSPYCRKVRLALGEKRLPFELRLERPWDQRDEFLDINPAGTVPVLFEPPKLLVPDSQVICEYLDEAFPETPLLGRTLAERVEVRRMVAWFDQKFAREVTDRLYGEKYVRRVAGRGDPNSTAIRAGYIALREHLDNLGWLVDKRRWLAGETMTLADLTAAAHLSTLDYLGEVDWTVSHQARDWYATIKSRPSFRPLLTDRVPGALAAAHYADLEF